MKFHNRFIDYWHNFDERILLKGHLQPITQEIYDMQRSSYCFFILGIVLLGATVLFSGCTEIDKATTDESVHITAICDVLVIDKAGNPQPGIPVSFTSVKFTGTSPKDGSEFNLQRSTESNGKTSFTVGYNLREQNMGFPVQDAVSLSASIPGNINGGAVIGYQEARAQAAGTGTAVITKTITLQIPYEVK
jgi:hypothetical protein